MAKAISDDELQLKKRARRRLVGAIALVLVVVVFLPMFLDSEPKPLSQDIAINIPSIPPVEQAPAPVPEQPPAAAAPVQPPAASASPPAEEAQASRTRPEPAKAATTSKPTPGESTDGYVVQLGAFSSPAKAKQLVSKLKENRFRAYTQTVKIAGGELTRVRVGSYPTKEAAEKARDQLRSRRLVIGEATIVRNDS